MVSVESGRASDRTVFPILSTFRWIKKRGKMDLYTELSTLSTFFDRKTIGLHSIFPKNVRFVDCDKKEKNVKKVEKRLTDEKSGK